MKYRIYQVNIGGYDTEREHKIGGVDYKYVTEIDNSTGDPFRDSRIAKFNPPFDVDESSLILYIDGAFQITEDGITDWMENQIQDYDMVFNASFNVADCYEEGERVLLRGIGDASIINKQLKDYKAEGVQGNNNHAFGGIFIFKDSQKTRDFLKAWEEEFNRYPSRDQLALHKLRQQTELNIGWINPYSIVKFAENYGFKHQFTYHSYHNKQDRPIINFISGWDSYKQIGKSLNRQIERMGDDEWVCVTDGDVQFLTSFYGKQMEECIMKYPDTAIFGCLTNRIGLEYQQYDGMSDNMDILHHKRIADELARNEWANCERIDEHVAGMLQLFPKKYWDKSPYQEHLFDRSAREGKGALFDWTFCDYAIDNDLPVRLMKGVYVFHGYRLNASKETAKFHIEHLI